MTFEAILKQRMALLQRQGRVSYRALKRQFDMDEAYVEDVKLELILALYHSHLECFLFRLP